MYQLKCLSLDSRPLLLALLHSRWIHLNMLCKRLIIVTLALALYKSLATAAKTGGKSGSWNVA
jgi:hypothetical protein